MLHSHEILDRYCPNPSRKIRAAVVSPFPVYKPILEKYPIYTHEDVEILANRLKELLSEGKGFEIFNKFINNLKKRLIMHSEFKFETIL